jgi:hypothetical protein
MSLPNPINVTYVSPQSGDTFPFIYIVKDTDNIINVDTTHGEVHVILRNIRNSGMLQYQPLLSINDGGNNASVNNITIYPSEGDIINDSDFYILNDNGANTIIQISNINQWVVSSSQSGATPPIPFEGTNYIYVYGNGTDTENGDELKAAYTLAQSKSPTVTNRYTVIVGAGKYFNSDGIGQFVFTTDYIDVISLTGEPDVFLSGISVGGDCFIKGMNISQATSLGGVQVGFNLASSPSTQKIENCIGGNNSFGWGGNVNGTFINCIGGNSSFASASSTSSPIGITNLGGGNIGGVFTDCVAGNNSFGNYTFFSVSYLTGTFTNCRAGNDSFGNDSFNNGGTTISGLFTNCIGLDRIFGANQFTTLSGTFKNCKGGESAFVGGVTTTSAGNISNTAILEGCEGGVYSFSGQGGYAQGKLTNCKASDYSFGAVAGGIFTNCNGGIFCFGTGSSLGDASGSFTNCVAGKNSFGYTTNVPNANATGIFNNCVAGDFSFGYLGNVFGTFSNCIGGQQSWTPFGFNLTGKLYFCRQSNGNTVPSPSLGGRIVAFITGENNFIAQNP